LVSDNWYLGQVTCTENFSAAAQDREVSVKENEVPRENKQNIKSQKIKFLGHFSWHFSIKLNQYSETF